jgi:hypothetical protein
MLECSTMNLNEIKVDHMMMLSLHFLSPLWLPNFSINIAESDLIRSLSPTYTKTELAAPPELTMNYNYEYCLCT